MRHLRLLAASVILGAVISACGITAVFQELPEADCSLKPVGEWTSGLRFGPQVARATTCATRVEVDGRSYDVGVGRWLDEDALELTVYAPITR